MIARKSLDLKCLLSYKSCFWLIHKLFGDLLSRRYNSRQLFFYISKINFDNINFDFLRKVWILHKRPPRIWSRPFVFWRSDLEQPDLRSDLPVRTSEAQTIVSEAKLSRSTTFLASKLPTRSYLWGSKTSKARPFFVPPPTRSCLSGCPEVRPPYRISKPLCDVSAA